MVKCIEKLIATNMQYLAAYTLSTLSGKEPSNYHIIQLKNHLRPSLTLLVNQLMQLKLKQS